MIDYGLRNPTGIQKIEAYELPSDDALIMQEVLENIDYDVLIQNPQIDQEQLTTARWTACMTSWENMSIWTS